MAARSPGTEITGRSAVAKSKRILHVVSNLHPRMGGSIVAGLQMADCVHGNGFECTVVGTVHPSAAGEAGADQLRREFPRLDIRTFPNHFPRHSFASTALKRWLTAHASDYDLLHSHGIFNFPYLYAGQAARATGMPFVISPHNSLDPFDLQKKRLLKKYWYGPYHVRPMLNSAVSLLCTATREAAEAESYGADISREVLALPVPEPSGAAAPRLPAERREFLAAHDLPPDALVLLYLSRFDRKKGLELALRALARIRDRRSNVYFCIAGGGDEAYARELRRLTVQLGIADRVRWLGFTHGEQKALAYRSCDLFVLTSYNENFGIVLVEALYYGVPLVISDQIYISDVLAESGVAQVCRPDVEQVVEALGRAIESHTWRERVQEEGRATARRLFAPSELADQYRAFYESHIPSGTVGSPAGYTRR